MTSNDIIGNEHAKRACDIAIKGKLKILFIGNSEAEDFVTCLNPTLNITAKALQPCKCGSFEDPRVDCSCSPEQVLKQKRVIDNVSRNWADIVVRTQSPSKDKVSQWLEETYKDILESDSLHLLTMGYDKLNLTVSELKKVIEVGKTIAEMDNSEKVLPLHTAEALQYRNR